MLKILNKIALLLCYLAQSFFVQSWIRMIILVNRFPKEKLVRWLFAILDLAVAALTGLMIGVLITQNSASTWFIRLNQAFGGVYGLLALIFVIVGGVAIRIMHLHNRKNAKLQTQFIVFSILIVATSVSRMCGLIYDA